MDKRYNVYYSGQVLEGHATETVRLNLAKLFNANEPTLDKLFSGDLQLLKKDCSPEEARKYKAAMERAGAMPIIRSLSAAQESSEATTPPSQIDSPPPQTAAEKIAALAAAADESPYGDNAGSEKPGHTAEDKPSAKQADSSPGASEVSNTSSGGEFDITPPGSNVLEAHERKQTEPASIDTSGFTVDETAERLSEEPDAPPPSPDVSHLDMGEVGEVIPTLEEDNTPLNPDTSGIDLSPEGTDFSDCQPEEAVAPDVDLSGIEVAPQGSDVLEDKYRNKEDIPAPATGHISLQD